MKHMKILAIFLVLLFVNMSPAAAEKMADVNEDLNDIEQWMEGNNWYKILFFNQFISSTDDLISHTDALEQSTRACALPEGDYWMRQHLALTQNQLHADKIYSNVYEGDPVPGVIVQLKWRDSPKTEYRQHTLHYWYLSSYVEENGQIMAVLNDGQKEIKISKEELNNIYTGYGLQLNDINTAPRAIAVIKQMQQETLEKDIAAFHNTYLVGVMLLIMGIILLGVSIFSGYTLYNQCETFRELQARTTVRNRHIQAENAQRILNHQKLKDLGHQGFLRMEERLEAQKQAALSLADEHGHKVYQDIYKMPERNLEENDESHHQYFKTHISHERQHNMFCLETVVKIMQNNPGKKVESELVQPYKDSCKRLFRLDSELRSLLEGAKTRMFGRDPTGHKPIKMSPVIVEDPNAIFDRDRAIPFIMKAEEMDEMRARQGMANLENLAVEREQLNNFRMERIERMKMEAQRPKAVQMEKEPPIHMSLEEFSKPAQEKPHVRMPVDMKFSEPVQENLKPLPKMRLNEPEPDFSVQDSVQLVREGVRFNFEKQARNEYIENHYNRQINDARSVAIESDLQNMGINPPMLEELVETPKFKETGLTLLTGISFIIGLVLLIIGVIISVSASNKEKLLQNLST